MRVVLLWWVLLLTAPVYAMNQGDGEHSICHICHNALVPVVREEFADLLAAWAEYPDLCKKLTKVITILQSNPELKARLSALTWDQIADMQESHCVFTDQRLRPVFDQVQRVVPQLVVQKLLCHDSLIPQFHLGCLKNALRMSLNCPICRKPFLQESLEQLGFSFEQITQEISVNTYEQNRAFDSFERLSELPNSSKNVYVLTTIVLLGICYLAIELGLWPHWIGMTVVSSLFLCLCCGGLYGILKREINENYLRVAQMESDEEDDYFDA